MTFSVAANTGAARTGSLSIAGQIVNVSQAAGSTVLTINTAGGGSGTVSASPSGLTYAIGTVVTLTATPNAGSSFTGWSGACSGTGACVLTMDANKTVTATFTLVANFDGTYSGSESATATVCFPDPITGANICTPASATTPLAFTVTHGVIFSGGAAAGSVGSSGAISFTQPSVSVAGVTVTISGSLSVTAQGGLAGSGILAGSGSVSGGTVTITGTWIATGIRTP